MSTDMAKDEGGAHVERWCVQDVAAADVPVLAGLLPAGADLSLPEREAERWWLVRRPGRAACACLRLRPAIGLEQPRHWYHVGCVVHAAAELGLFQRRHTLLLCNDHTGAAELADIVSDAAALDLDQQADALRLLVHHALRHIAQHRGTYPAQLVAELPGVRDAQGRSPFWLGLGAHFYEGDPQEAARRFGPAWRGHVAALLPRQPVYAAFLAADAQSAIAQVAPPARVLMQVLADAGLRYSHHVTVDDGGPVQEGWIDGLPAVLGGGGPRS